MYDQFAAAFETTCLPETLDIIPSEGGYCLMDGDRPLVTREGHRYWHVSEETVQLMLTDFQLFPGSVLHPLSSPVLFSFCKDVLGNSADPILVHWEEAAGRDPFIRIKTSGGTGGMEFPPDHPLFPFAYQTLAHLLEVLNRFAARRMSELSMEDSEQHPFLVAIRLTYEGLTQEQKTGLQALSRMHDAGIILPLLLVLEEIRPVQYAKAICSLGLRASSDFQRLTFDAALVENYLSSLSSHPHDGIQLAALISAGENEWVEFKSTLRWDIRAGKTNPAIERSSLKTLAAFLNTDGGTLLIGVRDDGSVEGIETDKLPNEDRFLLHLWTLIRTCLGTGLSPFMRTRLVRTDGKTVCAVSCKPSAVPVFLRQPGFPEEMYIRVGPSSNALEIREALDYIANHFPNHRP